MRNGAETVGETLRRTLSRGRTLPLLVAATGLLIALAPASGGYFVTSWAPAALLMLGLLVVALVALPAPAPPRLVTVAVAALAAYAAWSYLSILWASQRADAWDGANRTAFYAACFALFALWRPRARQAGTLLTIYALAVAVLAIVELLHASASPATSFVGGRLVAPVGYSNAAVALWSSACVACIALAAQRTPPVAVRALLAGAAVVLGAAALLGESRGWLFAAPVALAILLALSRSRVRTTLTLLLVAVAVAAVAAPLLDVYPAAGSARFPHAVDRAVRGTFVAAAATAVIFALVAAVDRRRRASARLSRFVALALVVLAAVGAIGGLAAVSARAGDPWTALRRGWRSFKHSPEPHGGSSHFSQSLGSNRYDFWRVAWGRFVAAPVAGIGADNFQVAYLARRRSYEEPRYPHSVELRTLSQTGIVGAVLLAIAFGAALLAAVRGSRRRGQFGAGVAVGAAGLCAYWLVHGSVDWLWEFPALGAAAFCFLGLAAALLPRPATVPRHIPLAGALHAGRPRRAGARPARWRRPLAVAAGATVACALAASIALPWLAAREQNIAISTWRARPAAAYSRLRTAAALNPLSPVPDELAASIALASGEPGRAERLLRRALARQPQNQYAVLKLGAIVADRGDRAEGGWLLRQARRLDPRDPVAAAALVRFERHRRVDVYAIMRAYAARTAQLTR